MKKEEYSSIAKNLQNISDGTLSIERTQTGENIGKTFFHGTVSSNDNREGTHGGTQCLPWY